MPKRRVFRVKRASRGGWDLVPPDGPGSRHGTKSLAVEAGRRWARSSRPSQLVIHLKNGRIQTEHTYGKDPRRFPG